MTSESGAEGATDVSDTRRAPSSVAQAVEQLRWTLEEAADPGTLAALRRMDTNSPPPAFFRVATRLLDHLLPRQAAHRDQLESRWAIVAQVLAMAVGRRGSSSLLSRVPLGEALAHANVAEMRLLRLLDAPDEQLADVVRGIMHQLVSKGQSFDPVHLATFVLSDGERREHARRLIAQHYYRHQAE